MILFICGCPFKLDSIEVVAVEDAPFLFTWKLVFETEIETN